MVLLLLVSNGCRNDNNQIVPYVYVELNVNLGLPQFSVLNSTNNAYLYPNVGYNHDGIIIYNYDGIDFFAFDATCPQHIDTPTAVKLDGGGSAGTATCPQCKTVYYLTNYGYPSKGYPLKRYSVIKSGNTLYVTN